MPSLPRNCSRPRLPPRGWPQLAQVPVPIRLLLLIPVDEPVDDVPLSVALVKPVFPIVSMTFSASLLSPHLARLVSTAVGSDARVSGLVGVVVFVVPMLADRLLIALAIGPVGAERSFVAGLLRCVCLGVFVGW